MSRRRGSRRSFRSILLTGGVLLAAGGLVWAATEDRGQRARDAGAPATSQPAAGKSAPARQGAAGRERAKGEAQALPRPLVLRRGGQDADAAGAAALPPGSRIRVIPGPRDGAAGRVDTLAIPPTGEIWADEVVASGTSGRAYPTSASYLVVSDDEGNLAWSVNGGVSPAYVRHDGTAISLSEAPAGSAAADRLRTLFPPEPDAESAPDRSWAWLLLGVVAGAAAFWAGARMLHRDGAAGAPLRAAPGRIAHTEQSDVSEESRRLIVDDVVRRLAIKFEPIYLDLALLRGSNTAPPEHPAGSAGSQARAAFDKVPAGAGPERQAARGPEMAAEPGGEGTASRLGRAFVSWCNNPNGDVSLFEGFQEQLRGVFPDAQVSLLPRNMNSAEVAFELGVKQRKDHWHVCTDGQDFLLPRPTSPQQFAELGPVFEGEASPRSLREIRPARLRNDGAVWRLHAKGAVWGGDA